MLKLMALYFLTLVYTLNFELNLLLLVLKPSWAWKKTKI